MPTPLTASSTIAPDAPYSTSAPDTLTLTGATANNSAGNGVGCGLGFDADSASWQWAASALLITELRIQFNWNWDIGGAECDKTGGNHSRLHLFYSINSGAAYNNLQAVQEADGSGSIDFSLGAHVDPSTVRVRFESVAYPLVCANPPACVATAIISGLQLMAIYNEPPSANVGQLVICI